VETRRGIIAERTGKRLKGLKEAAELLHLSVEAVQSLAGAGYLIPSEEEENGPAFAVSDLKGFMARNAEGGSAEMFLSTEDAADPKALLEALDSRADEMALKALAVFRTAAPETSLWTKEEQLRFVEQARKRFEAILAVTTQGEEVDESLVTDLQDVGASAAWAGSPLPQLLVVLRISRDLVVHTAVEIADERGRHWGLALSLLLTRVLPAMDRLTDALAQGYWAAVVGREETDRARYEHVVESSSDGIYELDLTGRLSYTNPSLAAILGVPALDLEGARLEEVFTVVGESDALARLDSPEDGEVDFEVLRSDGVRRELHVTTFPRYQEGAVVGFQGVVRDVTAVREADRAKNEFLAMVTQDLRHPITTILGLAVTLEAYATELPAERVRRMGASIRHQAERVSRLADDLYEVSRLESHSLRLNLRTTDLGSTVEAALASLDDPSLVDVRIPDGITVLADGRRLEQVVANLVENALEHGGPPVAVAADETAEGVELVVSDAGPGVPGALVPALFARLGPQSGDPPTAGDHPGAGIGLFLVRGLVEAMGGRVAYEPGPGGKGAIFRVRLVRR
jgi:PAS domain S-box-containing protein